MTIHKAQGMSLAAAVVYFDSPHAQPGLGYTAVSRMTTAENLRFVGAPTIQHFRPVS